MAMLLAQKEQLVLDNTFFKHNSAFLELYYLQTETDLQKHSCNICSAIIQI